MALKVDWKFDYLLDAATKLEKEIINDSLAYKFFISQEDLNFYQLITGRFQIVPYGLLDLNFQIFLWNNQRVFLN